MKVLVIGATSAIAKATARLYADRNAELFVSIHANASKRKSAHGIETYFLGTTNNDRALATVARENGELVHSVKDDQIQQILASLITTTKINDSSRLAGTVQDNLFRSSRKKFRELKDLGVKEGPFYVLHGADMPSILVEVGF
jgi:N-acetylmuramoyl-L-alanine amidase